jgi:uncharacterized membrane protein
MVVWNWLVVFFDGAMLGTILGLIVIDVLFGIWASLKAGSFDWRKVGNFYLRSVGPYVGGYLTVWVVFALVPQIREYTVSGMTVAALLAGIVAKLGGSIAANFAKLTK